MVVLILLPIMLDIKEREILVVGGGKIATRKIKSLLLECANVTVMSSEITEEISKLNFEYKNHLKLIKEDYSKAAITDNYMLVIAATNNREVNEEIWNICRNKNILCSVVDNKELSDLTFVSFVRRGDLTIGISTNGKSPSLAVKIKKEIEKNYGPEYEEYIALLGNIRDKIINSGMDQESKKDILNSLIDKDIEELKEICLVYDN